MAKLIFYAITIFSLLFIVMPKAYNAQHQDYTWSQNLGNEKVVELHFYIHEFLGGENMTVYEVARASITSNSPTMFGQVLVANSILMAGHDINSEKLGRLQGLVAFSDLEVTAFTMNMMLYFTEGEYNGSTICISGRNQFYNESRELADVGGTGKFREARGYAITNTYSYDTVANHLLLEYKVYVRYVEREELHATS